MKRSLQDGSDYVLSTEGLARIHAAHLGRLIDEGAVMTAQHIADLEPVRLRAVFVACTRRRNNRPVCGALCLRVAA